MSSGAASPNSFQEMIPLLVEVQRNLDQDLDLQTLAEKYGYSPFHFQRIFSNAMGETPKEYVERLRLEKAAYKLQITDGSILDICLSVGFKNHETFTRAFRRYFGSSPRDCRKHAKVLQGRRLEANRSFRGNGCCLSEVKFESLRATHLLSVLHVGAYSEIPAAFTEDDQIWNTLADWAKRHNVPYRLIPLSFTMTIRRSRQEPRNEPMLVFPSTLLSKELERSDALSSQEGNTP